MIFLGAFDTIDYSAYPARLLARERSLSSGSGFDVESDDHFVLLRDFAINFACSVSAGSLKKMCMEQTGLDGITRNQ